MKVSLINDGPVTIILTQKTENNMDYFDKDITMSDGADG